MARILVIDDDEPIQRLLKLTLDRRGHEVLQAFNGKEGVRLFRAESPDLVLTDILMPEQDGLQTILQINRTHPGARIIAMSGGSRHWDLIDQLPVAHKFGAKYLLYKPFGVEELFEAIDAVVAPRREAEASAG